jgi:hypothetical protein
MKKKVSVTRLRVAAMHFWCRLFSGVCAFCSGRQDGCIDAARRSAALLHLCLALLFTLISYLDLSLLSLFQLLLSSRMS